MAMNVRHCPVLGSDVTIVTDLEGVVTSVICTEYEPATGSCGLKRRALEGGPLAQLLERTAEHGLGSRSFGCQLRG
jgi:hypothetical protein